MEVDFVEAARVGTRDLFVAAYGFPFLVGLNVLAHPSPERPTTQEGRRPHDFESALTTRTKTPRMRDPLLQVFPVRKSQDAFASMITVGRSRNNDIILDDMQVSKFHAYFAMRDGGVELFDAGSRNGTFVADVRLEPKGPSVKLRVGDVIRFATFEYQFLDAAGCFDRVRELVAVDDSL